MSFYYKELPIEPSLAATFDYRIHYPLANSDDYVNSQMYITHNHVNIAKNCSFQKHS